MVKKKTILCLGIFFVSVFLSRAAISQETQKIDKTTKSLMQLYLVENWIDICQTQKAIQKGGKELNPLMKPLVEEPELFVLVKLGVAYWIYEETTKLSKEDRRLARNLAIALNVMQIGVIWHNKKYVGIPLTFKF